MTPYTTTPPGSYFGRNEGAKRWFLSEGENDAGEGVLRNARPARVDTII